MRRGAPSPAWLGVALQVVVPMLIGAFSALRMVGYW
jgi:hypothetical protein